MHKEKLISFAKIGPLLDVNEDSFNFHVDNAFMDFMAQHGDIAVRYELFKAGAEWFRDTVKRNVDFGR